MIDRASRSPLFPCGQECLLDLYIFEIERCNYKNQCKPPTQRQPNQIRRSRVQFLTGKIRSKNSITSYHPSIHPYPVMMAAMTMISTMFMSDIQMQLWTTNRLSLSHSVDGKGGSSSYFTMWLGTSLGTVSTYLQISYACKLVSYSIKLNLQFTV